MSPQVATCHNAAGRATRVPPTVRTSTRACATTRAAATPHPQSRQQQQQQPRQQPHRHRMSDKDVLDINSSSSSALPAAVARLLASAVVASAIAWPGGAHAATAEANFNTKCLGCHVAGGNIIQAGATLFQEDLVKNGAADADSLYGLVYSGKGRMPGFGEECAPRGRCTFGPRLTDKEVKDLVAFVQENAAAGWKQQ